MPQSILITGCSSGIGLCAAKTLQNRGYKVFAGVRKAQDKERLSHEGLHPLLLDLSDSGSIRTALAQLLQQTGGTLDAVFNNAGFAIPGAVEDLSRDMIREQFETNVFGTIELTNLILPIMRQQGLGRIIFNTSILGIVTMPYRGAYSASKFALEGFAQTLRQELRGSKIHVSIIAPGPIQTNFRQNAYKTFQTTLSGKQSVHLERYATMEKTFLGKPSVIESQVTHESDVVVKKLIHALESPRPKARYYVGIPAHLFGLLRRILPERILDWVIGKTS